jgi:hypothetical protein
LAALRNSGIAITLDGMTRFSLKDLPADPPKRALTRLAFRLVLTLLLLAGLATPQVVAPPQPVPQQKQQKEEQPRVSKAEADELFRSVDSILKWVGNNTGLPIKHPVKRELVGRAEVQKYVEDRTRTDEDAQRLKRSELVLKKFGLLPREFDLSTFLVQLLREQVVGFYDPKKQTVYMLNWVEAEQQRPVLAHELTHALQDQNFDLDKWLRAGVSPPKAEGKGGNGGSDSKFAEKEQRELQKEIDADELQAARQAVTEGQGMAVLLDFTLEPMGRTVANSPGLIEAMKQNIQSGGDSPIFQNAPVFLREALTFPYRYGLGFVQALLIKGGSKLAYGGVLQNPPVNSRQIMEPKTYLDNERIEPMHIPAISPLIGREYQRFDVGAMGEFDVYLLLEQYAGERTATRLAPHWRGGYYYAAQKKDGNAAKGSTAEPTTASLGMVYVSRWETERAANDFAAMYAAGLPARYGPVKPPANEERAGKGTVWTTGEGPVFIQTMGNVVIATESFSEAIALKLRDAVMQTEHAVVTK